MNLVPFRSLARSHAALVLSVLAVTAALYRRALGTPLAADDIAHLSCVAGLAACDDSVRPLSNVLAFGALYDRFGIEPLGYHVVNLALHLVNTALVYAVSLRLGGSRGVAASAALLFGASSIAFTPLHWATGLVELLTTTLVLGATWLHLEAAGRAGQWRWIAALMAFAAMLSKETAVAWVLVVAWIEWRGRATRSSLRTLVPAALATAAFAMVWLSSGHRAAAGPSGPYALDLSPEFLIRNLSTYLRWSAAVHEPMRDLVAGAEPAAWRVALPLALLLAAGVWWQRRDRCHPLEVGLGWWLTFLLPVLPLAHHTYLFYLYLPWAGGALAVAALGRRLLAGGGTSSAALALLLLGGYVWSQARAISVRETARRDHLLVDRVLREAELLGNAVPALRAAALPAGTAVAFVNPAPRPAFDLTTGRPTRPADRPERTSYWPLEAALRGGETLRLIVPGVEYRGFSTGIPPHLEDAEWFHFDHLGRLERWGRGQRALLRQAEVQMAARRWAAAEDTWARVRDLGDTLPEALRGQMTALRELGRTERAQAVEEELRRRWPAEAERLQ